MIGGVSAYEKFLLLPRWLGLLLLIPPDINDGDTSKGVIKEEEGGEAKEGEDGRGELTAMSTYGGGSAGMIVPGKNLGTNGSGPDIGGESSDALVCNESCLGTRGVRRKRVQKPGRGVYGGATEVCEAEGEALSRSRLAEALRRRMIEIVIPSDIRLSTPTDPPTAAPNVATLRRFCPLLDRKREWGELSNNG